MMCSDLSESSPLEVCSMNVRVSAIICTHNRSAYLNKAIQSLADQTLPREQYEVIVVDNGSTDDTKAIVESLEHFGNLRYIYEPILGLSQARNTGWQNARGEYIAFLDDDAIACPEWLERVVEAFENVNPRPGSVGGKVIPIWEVERPAWLSKQMELFLSIVDWADKPILLTEDYQFLAGVNFACPCEILKAFGGFSTTLGRKGSKLLSGEEILLRDYLTEQNLENYYDPEIYVQHHIPAERLVKRWFYRRYFWHGVSNEILQYIETSPKEAHWRYLGRALMNALGLIRFLTILLPMLIFTNSDSRVARKCGLYARLGKILTRLRIGFGMVSIEKGN